ncbi:minor capsid protein [Bacillus cereus]
MTQDKQEKYWTKRKQQIIKVADKHVDDGLLLYQAFFQEKLSEIELLIQDYYDKYGKNNVIEYYKLMQEMSVSERKDLYSNYQVLITKFPQLNNFTEIRYSFYKLQRLDGLMVNIMYKLYEMGAMEEEILKDKLSLTYQETYYRNLYDNAMYYGMTGTYHAVSEEVLRATLYKKWVKNQNFSDRVWGNTKQLTLYLQDELPKMLSTGTSYKEVTKQLRNNFDVKWHEAERLARTESAFITEHATQDAYKRDGIKQYRVLSTLDRRTSKICQEQDGKVYDLDKAVVGKNYPPFHPHCRTTTISATSIIEYRAMNINRGYERVPDMTYKKWEDTYVKAT